MAFDPSAIPKQPGEQTWTFIEDLRSRPYHQPVSWKRRAPRPSEAAFPGGVRLESRFESAGGRLDTAYRDFHEFLKSVGLPADGAFPIRTRRAAGGPRESFRVAVGESGCDLSAPDTEGIRRGLVWLEDELLKRGGPFLPLGAVRRRPFVRTRLSRCFYGPVNRPPKCKDELADGVDYYPEAYLDRLAHQGVNGLWMTVHFFQTVPSRIIPEYGRGAAPRLAKLRRVIDKCGRYGIRIYPFCIEPAAFNWPYPEVRAAFKAHPDLHGNNEVAFCTSSAKGKAYLEEATGTLFREAPGLGGLMVIPVGERLTSCCSGAIPGGNLGWGPNTCPRCSKREPWAVLADTLSALARGMQSVDPEAELIAWPYGQFISWGFDNTVKAAGKMPRNVILQHNFETGGHNRQLGTMRPTWDYWLSYTGPSALFEKCARAAVRHGTRMGAKLQVSCSHEVATTQVVPAPGLLYTKYKAMRRLGVSAAMHSWYFGAYPSLMTQAAGLLLFEPFPAREGDFLLDLARRDWGRHAPDVVRAWRHFRQGYARYPTAHIFGYFGPMHDGPVWPLYLEPRRLPLAPTWQIGYAPSGDYIAECVVNGFTLRELVVLTQRMAAVWERGVRILQRVKPHVRNDPDRVRDIGLAAALGIQFRSGANILRFYDLRERLAESRAPGRRRRILGAMRTLAQAELKLDAALLPLAEADSRLGFHSEAEGYKYFPALIRWRMRQVRRLLQAEFPAVERRIRQPGGLFPAYTGERPEGPACRSRFLDRAANAGGAPRGAAWAGAPAAECAHWLRRQFSRERWRRCAYDPDDHVPLAAADAPRRVVAWQAGHDREALHLLIRCRAPADERSGSPFRGHTLQVLIEPQRTLPRLIWHLEPDGRFRTQRDDGYIPVPGDRGRAWSRVEGDAWTVLLTIPFAVLGRKAGRAARPPVRVNVILSLPAPEEQGTLSCSWVPRQPVKGRLVWGTLNPATDFGWLIFEPRRSGGGSA